MRFFILMLFCNQLTFADELRLDLSKSEEKNILAFNELILPLLSKIVDEKFTFSRAASVRLLLELYCVEVIDG